MGWTYLKTASVEKLLEYNLKKFNIRQPFWSYEMKIHPLVYSLTEQYTATAKTINHQDWCAYVLIYFAPSQRADVKIRDSAECSVFYP